MQRRPISSFSELSRTSRIIWGALLASLGFDAGLLWKITLHPKVPQPGSAGMGRTLAIVALATAAVSFVFSKILYSPERVARAARGSEARAAQRAQSGMIVGWSLALSVGIYGLVWGMTQASFQSGLPFIGSGALLLVAQFPRPKTYEEAFRRMGPDTASGAASKS